MNTELNEELSKIKDEFTISNNTLLKIADSFYNDMINKSMLKMLKAYISYDDNILPGEYLAIDLGGSNIRASKFLVSEDNILLLDMVKIPLKGGIKNYTSSKYSLEDLFVMVLKKFSKYLDKDRMYTMGVTISFGLNSTKKDRATIIDLSKGFELSDTLGEDIYEILTSAIYKVGLKIIPAVIVNDVVSTILTGRFYNPNADIGIIVGTGHNSCFIDKNNEIINIESGNFNKDIPLTKFDEKYLLKIPKESSKLLEVLVGGKYIGSLANEIIKYLVKKGLVKDCGEINTKVMIKCLNKKFSFRYSFEQIETLNFISELIFERASKLIVAEILAILKFIDPKLTNKHTIIFDGSVYEKCEFFREEITRQIGILFMDYSSQISHKLIKDASSMGAVIAVSYGK